MLFGVVPAKYQVSVCRPYLQVYDVSSKRYCHRRPTYGVVCKVTRSTRSIRQLVVPPDRAVYLYVHGVWRPFAGDFGSHVMPGGRQRWRAEGHVPVQACPRPLPEELRDKRGSVGSTPKRSERCFNLFLWGVSHAFVTNVQKRMANAVALSD